MRGQTDRHTHTQTDNATYRLNRPIQWKLQDVIFFWGCLAIMICISVFDYTLFYPLHMIFYQNSRFKSFFPNSSKKGNFENYFLTTYILEGSNWFINWFNVVLTQWFNLGSFVGLLKKLISNSSYVMEVPFGGNIKAYKDLLNPNCIIGSRVRCFFLMGKFCLLVELYRGRSVVNEATLFSL